MSGHLGESKTLQQFKRMFYWLGHLHEAQIQWRGLPAVTSGFLHLILLGL